MNKQISNYYQQVTKTPWGKLFYDVLFKQIGEQKGLMILDFGSGFGVTASYYAKANEVTAIEPNEDMLSFINEPGQYRQLIGDEAILDTLPANYFDLIMCHNVLEYTNKQAVILNQLLRLLKVNGQLSLVVHNKEGALIQDAVLFDNPKEALRKAEKGSQKGLKQTYFGTVNYLEMNQLKDCLRGANAIVRKSFGIRSMYGLSQNNEIKNTTEWYRNMLALELLVAEQEPYKGMAFYRHLVIEKCCYLEQ